MRNRWEAERELSKLREPRVRRLQSGRAEQRVPGEVKFSSSGRLGCSVRGRAGGGAAGACCGSGDVPGCLELGSDTGKRCPSFESPESQGRGRDFCVTANPASLSFAATHCLPGGPRGSAQKASLPGGPGAALGGGGCEEGEMGWVEAPPSPGLTWASVFQTTRSWSVKPASAAC